MGPPHTVSDRGKKLLMRRQAGQQSHCNPARHVCWITIGNSSRSSLIPSSDMSIETLDAIFTIMEQLVLRGSTAGWLMRTDSKIDACSFCVCFRSYFQTVNGELPFHFLVKCFGLFKTVFLHSSKTDLLTTERSSASTFSSFRKKQ